MTRPSLSQAIQLLQDIEAGAFDAERLEFVRKHPQGPLLPPGCWKAERLLDHGKVEDVAADHDGRAWVIQWDMDGGFRVSGNWMHVIQRTPNYRIDSARIEGFTDDGEPLVALHETAEPGTVNYPYRKRFFRGSEEILDDDGWTFISGNWFQDGRLACVAFKEKVTTMRVLVDGRPVSSLPTDYDELPFRFYFCGDTLLAMNAHGFGPLLSRSRAFEHALVDVACVDGPFHVIAHDMNIPGSDARDPNAIKHPRSFTWDEFRMEWKRTDDNALVDYLRGYGRHPWTGDVCYVQRSKHDQERWVIGCATGFAGRNRTPCVALPSFERVSPIFNDEGFYYYGVTGQIVCKMSADPKAR